MSHSGRRALVWGASELQLAHISLKFIWSRGAALLCSYNHWAIIIWPLAPDHAAVCHLPALHAVSPNYAQCVANKYYKYWIVQKHRVSNHCGSLKHWEQKQMEAAGCWVLVSTGCGNRTITRTCARGPAVDTLKSSGGAWRMSTLIQQHNFQIVRKMFRFQACACVYVHIACCPRSLLSVPAPLGTGPGPARCERGEGIPPVSDASFTKETRTRSLTQLPILGNMRQWTKASQITSEIHSRYWRW